MRILFITCVFLTSFLWVSLSNAASHKKLVYLEHYDLNKDGELNKAEFNQARRQQFNLTDEDDDGMVDEKEYVFEYTNRMDKQLEKDRKGQVKQTVVRFKSLDKNENKQMEWEEYQASGLRSYQHYDVNNDGVINEQDPLPVKKTRKKKEKVKTALDIASEKQHKINRAKRLLKMPTTHNREGFFTKYDLDTNTIIDRNEFDLRRRQDFDRADDDRNGWLSEQEYRFEYENRLDAQIEKTRKAAIKQTYVRFGILDKDKNNNMTFAEYQASGVRSFTRWDTNKDGVVNMQDPMPDKRHHSKNSKTAKSVSVY